MLFPFSSFRTKVIPPFANFVTHPLSYLTAYKSCDVLPVLAGMSDLKNSDPYYSKGEVTLNCYQQRSDFLVFTKSEVTLNSSQQRNDFLVLTKSEVTMFLKNCSTAFTMKVTASSSTPRNKMVFYKDDLKLQWFSKNNNVVISLNTGYFCKITLNYSFSTCYRNKSVWLWNWMSIVTIQTYKFRSTFG